MTKSHALKRCANRRLYDSVISKHVTRDDVYAFIRQGGTVHVTAENTKKDQTPPLLFDVVRDQEMAVSDQKGYFFTRGFLLELIRSSIGPNRILVGEFLSHSLTNLQRLTKAR